MPCDYSTYHPEWETKIRPDILERDGHKCKFCGIPNYEIGWRDFKGDWNKLSEGHVGDVEAEFAKELGYKVIKVVLTVAHLDGNKDNNDYDNLASLCQKCHLSHDKVQHMTNSRLTRERNKGLQRLF